ncbi:hypothetical protein [Hippea sp. KM1]|uniref:hypothetical protein n=1 Tax=Hippea sp. KM1 TaxID=944481 RepID=UPI00046CE726|nr:hypothetical protein [Hippea sp. KM1]
MENNFKRSIVAVSILFPVILIIVVYFTYERNIYMLKDEILNEYLSVYIDTRKDHLMDLVNHVYNDIDLKRKNLKVKIKAEIENYMKITEDIIDSLRGNSNNKKIVAVLDSINKGLCGRHIRIFVIDEKTKKFIVKPCLGITEKALLKGDNPRFISIHRLYKPKGWIIGAVADYEKFENDLKRCGLSTFFYTPN